MSSGYNSALPAEAIASRFAALGEWITGFVINGVRYGGMYVPAQDERALRFVETLRSKTAAPKLILECGCLEGGHTVAIAKAFPGARVQAVDVRPESLTKARTVAEIVGCENIDFQVDDLDETRACLQRRYDAIFCVGLLYHLSKPREFLRAACTAAPVLWLWTVYCAEEEVARVEGAARGRLLPESTEHPLAAVRSESFLPTLGTLADYLWEAGYTNVELVKKEMTANGNGPAILLCATR